jgi:hypothetical protein
LAARSLLALGATLVVAGIVGAVAPTGSGLDARAVAKTRGALAPAPPARYSVPKPFVRVRTSAQLRAALARRTPRTIVLQGGVYDADEPFLNPNGHAIYAGRLGKAILTAGLSIGANDGRPGGSVRGVVFDVRDPEKTASDAVVNVWGDAEGAQVLDVRIRGNRAVRSGLVVRQPEGFRAARLVLRDFTDYGVVVDANDMELTDLDRPFSLSDVDVAGVARAVPRSSEGRGEACVWVGNPGSVTRVRVRRCAWSGLWTGTATTGALFDGIDIDESRTGVYMEHFTRQSTFQRLRIGRRVRTGINAEWADPNSNGGPASVDNVVQDSRIESWLAGVYLDEGTTRTIVRRSTFVGQRWAAIGDYKGVGNAYYANDYRGIARGAVPVTRAHIRTADGGS